LVVGIRITPIVAKTLVRYFGRGEGRRSHAGWIFGTIFHFKPVRAISARSAVSRCFFHRGECGFLHYEAMQIRKNGRSAQKGGFSQLTAAQKAHVRDFGINGHASCVIFRHIV